jgi:hypothetical protein
MLVPPKKRAGARARKRRQVQMFRWWKRKRKVHSAMTTYDHNEVNRVFGRLGCFGCTDWRPQRQRRYRQRVRFRPATR